MTFIFLSGGEFYGEKLFSEEELTNEDKFKTEFLPKLKYYQENVMK